MDRGRKKNVMIYSTEGGMDSEEAADKHPDKINKAGIDPKDGLQSYQARQIAYKLGLSGDAFLRKVQFVTRWRAAFIPVRRLTRLGEQTADAYA